MLVSRWRPLRSGWLACVLVAVVIFWFPAQAEPAWPMAVRVLQTHGFLPYRWIGGEARFPWTVPRRLQQAADRAGPLVVWNPFVTAALRTARVACAIPDVAHWRRKTVRCLTAAAPRAARRWRWVVVSLHRPETLRVWVAAGGADHGGNSTIRPGTPLHANARPSGWVFRAVVNTGVFRSTPTGTFSIRSRFRRVRMRGASPVVVDRWRVAAYDAAVARRVPSRLADLAAACGVNPGSPIAVHVLDGNTVCMRAYDDPDVRWVNYFDGGVAIHGYPRLRYGFPQSNGCVELPMGLAPILFPLLAVGVPVTVVRSG